MNTKCSRLPVPGLLRIPHEFSRGRSSSPGQSDPGDLLHVLLQVLFRPSNIEHSRVERVMSHDLSQPVQGNHLGHAIAEAMPQIVWTHISQLRPPGIFGNEVSQRSLRESSLRFLRRKEIATFRWKRFKIGTQDRTCSRIEGHITDFVALA